MEESLEIVNEFLVESHENLDQPDRDLVALEQDPTPKDLTGRIFRAIHTIKGTCGFLGFGKLEKVAHVGENLLSKLRDGEMELRPDITTGLLAQLDAILDPRADQPGQPVLVALGNVAGGVAARAVEGDFLAGVVGDPARIGLERLVRQIVLGQRVSLAGDQVAFLVHEARHPAIPADPILNVIPGQPGLRLGTFRFREYRRRAIHAIAQGTSVT